MEDCDYDVIVIGAGPGGEECATLLGKNGKRVAVVERERVGGECAFWACVPSKILLRSEQPYNESQRVPGSRAAVTGKPSFPQAAAWRTESVGNFDDADHVSDLRDNKVDLLRGDAIVESAGTVRVGDRTHTCKSMVIATGSDPVVPDIAGLEADRYWTPRDATSAGEVPKRLAIIGAGAVGVELAQVFARYESRVTLIESSAHVLPKDEPSIAKVMREALNADGVDILLGKHVKSVRWDAAGATIDLDGSALEADRILVATGRQGRLQNINAEALGLNVKNHFIEVDDRCRAGDGCYAVGDVTGVSLFTHVAKYQGRIAARNILGERIEANYDAIPRCLFTDPEVASVGLTGQKAQEAKLDVVSAEVELTSVARANLYYEKPVDGRIVLIADKEKKTVVGASVIGPMASEMLSFATMAIASKMPVPALKEVVHLFLTFSEAFSPALEALRF